MTWWYQSTRHRCICFNTASGMRSHVTWPERDYTLQLKVFQYRKRYEVTCDTLAYHIAHVESYGFQYRKRYEVTCDFDPGRAWRINLDRFQYRKRYEVTCDANGIPIPMPSRISFNTASGMRSHVTSSYYFCLRM